jgi:NDP-sugar pyrophosphorylase family protein
VLETTLRQAAAAGLHTVCMPAWFDVDTPDDLRRLETVLDGSPPAEETGQTGRFLASLRR